MNRGKLLTPRTLNLKVSHKRRKIPKIDPFVKPLVPYIPTKWATPYRNIRNVFKTSISMNLTHLMKFINLIEILRGTS